MSTPSRMSRREARVHPAKVGHLTAVVADPRPDSRKQTVRLVASLGIRTIHETDVDSHLPSFVATVGANVLITDWTSETVKLVASMRRIRNPNYPLNELPVIAITPALTATGVKALLATGISAIVMRPLSPAMLFGYLWQAVNEKRAFIKTEEYFGPAHAGTLEDPASFIRKLRGAAEDQQRASMVA